MKKQFPCTFLCILTLLFTACKKSSDTDINKEEPKEAGLVLKVGNQEYRFADDAVHAGLAEDRFGMSWSQALHSGVLTCISKTPGTYNWDSDKTLFLFQPGNMPPARAFVNFYDDGQKISPGQLKLIRLEAVGERITGTFEVSNAGSFNLQTAEYMGESKIVGSFNVTRDF